MNYKMGDIIFASEAIKRDENDSIRSHLFVLIDDDGNVVPADYFGFVVSSNLDKSKRNSIYKYNEEIKRNGNNNLNVDSIVKCDQLMQIPSGNINKKIGEVDEEDLMRFLNAFESYLKEN